jgi:flagellar biosynthesis protein FlhF
MRVSTYFAPTLPEAMAQVRAALGPKAIVLNWRNVRGGVEISASIGGETQAPTPLPKPREETLANHFSSDDFDLREEWAPKPARPMFEAPRGQQRGLGALVKANAQANEPVLPKPPLRVPLAPLASKPSITPAPPARAQAPSITPLGAFLMRGGLTPKQAIAFGGTNGAGLPRALIDSLSTALRFAPVEAIPPKPILLVGPAGAGKSACAAKLAARTLAAGHEVLLISADSERCGGPDQLQALAKRLGARFQKVMTLADLTDLVGEARGRGMVVYVDAPAASPTQPADMRAIDRMIDETRLEPILCLPADMRPDDMEELALAYGRLGVTRAIATRFDLTSRRASVLYTLKTADIALAQVSATPYISGGVAIATPPRVAALMLDAFEDVAREDVA